MSNMAYCRFENTVSDMQDCLSAAHELRVENGNIVDEHDEELNEYERRAIRQMVDVAAELSYILNNLAEDL